MLLECGPHPRGRNEGFEKGKYGQVKSPGVALFCMPAAGVLRRLLTEDLGVLSVFTCC